jgi:hypothetical protein
MTAFSGTDPIKLSDFQGVDWLHAIKISIIQLQKPEAWLVKDACEERQVEKWLSHWQVHRGGFLKLMWREFEEEITTLRQTLPALRSSQEIAGATEMAACRLKKKKFPKTTRVHNIRHENSLVAFSKVALCIVPERAVVNDSWVREYFDITQNSNLQVAAAFESEFEKLKEKIENFLCIYKNSGSSFPPARLHNWTDLTLKRRVLDVAIMMAAGRSI